MFGGSSTEYGRVHSAFKSLKLTVPDSTAGQVGNFTPHVEYFQTDKTILELELRKTVLTPSYIIFAIYFASWPVWVMTRSVCSCTLVHRRPAAKGTQITPHAVKCL